MLALGICLSDVLLDLKQPCAARDAIALEGGRDGKADGLIRPALIRDHEVGVHGV